MQYIYNCTTVNPETNQIVSQFAIPFKPDVGDVLLVGNTSVQILNIQIDCNQIQIQKALDKIITSNGGVKIEDTITIPLILVSNVMDLRTGELVKSGSHGKSIDEKVKKEESNTSGNVLEFPGKS